MFLSFEEKSLDGKFFLTNEITRIQPTKNEEGNLIHILWNRSDETLSIKVDGVKVQLSKNQLTTLTFLQKVELPKDNFPITIFSFNREFYCIHTHDEEVSCNGIIFFGAQETPVISLNEHEIIKFGMLYEIFEEEFRTKDNIQGEMLRMLLKRLIIKITRLAKTQNDSKVISSEHTEVIRKFNALVDFHYREKRLVAEYADLLFKSPKTLSNIFSMYSEKTPLQIIHDRIILEAKRQLLYTDKTVKEIAQELGFHEVGSFHKMFKKVTRTTPAIFKKEVLS